MVRRKSRRIGIAQPPGKDKKGKDKDKKDEKPPEDDDIPYTFPYDRDAKNQLTAAREYLANFKDHPVEHGLPAASEHPRRQERLALQRLLHGER